MSSEIGQFLRDIYTKCADVVEDALFDDVNDEHIDNDDFEEIKIGTNFDRSCNDKADDNECVSEVAKLLSRTSAICSVIVNEALDYEINDDYQPGDNDNSHNDDLIVRDTLVTPYEKLNSLVNDDLSDRLGVLERKQRQLDEHLKRLKTKRQRIDVLIRKTERTLKVHNLSKEIRTEKRETNVETDKEEKDKTKDVYYKFGINYFKDNKGYNCPYENNDTKAMRRTGHIMLLDMNAHHFFKEKHLENLKNLLVKYWLDRVPSFNKRTNNNNNNNNNKNNNKRFLRDFERLLEENADKPIDWLALAAKSKWKLWSNPRVCQDAFNTRLNPKYTKTTFTQEEQYKLADLAKEFNYRNWDEIAARLGGDKDAFQCFVYYMCWLDNERQIWTPEDDDLLKRCVRKYRNNDGSVSWAQVSTEFPRRSSFQCYIRYTHRLKEGLKKGHFTTEEANLVRKYRTDGCSFGEIAQIMGDRSTSQIRDYFQNKTKTTNQGRWSVRETLALIRAIKQYGIGKWSEISKRLIGRDRTQCRLKFEHLRQLGYDDLDRALKDFAELNDDFDEVRKISNKRKNPLRNRWSAKETLQLIRAIKECGIGKWSEISEKLVGRDPIQCRSKFQNLRRMGYDDDLDRALNDFAEASDVDDDLAQVRTVLTKRKRLGPSIWSAQETSDLIRAIKECGIGKWSEISEKLVGRDPIQCRSKFHNLRRMGYDDLDRALNDFAEASDVDDDLAQVRTVLKKRKTLGPGVWSAQETSDLIRAIKECGIGEWSEISKRLVGHDPTQCRLKFQCLRRMGYDFLTEFGDVFGEPGPS